MIPKYIHYIWLGKNKKPASYSLAHASWLKYATDYEICEWHEDNIFEYQLPDYYHYLISVKRYAFASDILRFYILEKYGGVYMDVDQVLIRDITELISGVAAEFALAKYHEVDNYYGFGLLICKPHSIFSKEMIDFYKNYNQKDFVIVNKIGSEIINKMSQQEIKNIKIFDQDYFYPLTPNDYTVYTYAYHLANTSWMPAHKRILQKLPFYKNLKSLASKVLPKALKEKMGFNIKYL